MRSRSTIEFLGLGKNFTTRTLKGSNSTPFSIRMQKELQQGERLKKLNEIAITQMKSLLVDKNIRKTKIRMLTTKQPSASMPDGMSLRNYGRACNEVPRNTFANLGISHLLLYFLLIDIYVKIA
jgi:hypothetical protein